jgi:hypothetical protein
MDYMRRHEEGVYTVKQHCGTFYINYTGDTLHREYLNSDDPSPIVFDPTGEQVDGNAAIWITGIRHHGRHGWIAGRFTTQPPRTEDGLPNRPEWENFTVTTDTNGTPLCAIGPYLPDREAPTAGKCIVDFINQSERNTLQNSRLPKILGASWEDRIDQIIKKIWNEELRGRGYSDN